MTDQPRASAAQRFAVDTLWVIYTALTLVSVLVAITERTWDSILVACVWCYLRGRGRP